ncbi:MAG: EpsI family protein [Armatimonadetes bacterium]|nr:EpsI family protein [Armatimonadota bacterium]
MPHVGRMAALLMFLFGTGWLVAALTKPPPPAINAPLTDVTIPRHLLDYVGLDSIVDPTARKALAGTRLIARTYRRGGEMVQCVVMSGDAPGTLHDPRDCLAGSGWHVTGEHDERLADGQPIHACRAVERPGAADLDVVYLFVVDGRVTSDLASVRATMLWDALKGRSQGSNYLVRLSTPLPVRSRDTAVAHDHLLNFAARILACLPIHPRTPQKTGLL